MGSDLLKSFAAFAAERGQTHVVSQTAIDWAALGPTVAQRDARLRAVCRFVRHVQVEDVGHKLDRHVMTAARTARRESHPSRTPLIDRRRPGAVPLPLTLGSQQPPANASTSFPLVQLSSNALLPVAATQSCSPVHHPSNARCGQIPIEPAATAADRKSTRLNSSH